MMSRGGEEPDCVEGLIFNPCSILSVMSYKVSVVVIERACDFDEDDGSSYGGRYLERKEESESNGKRRLHVRTSRKRSSHLLESDQDTTQIKSDRH